MGCRRGPPVSKGNDKLTSPFFELISLFPAATTLVHVAFEGLTFNKARSHSMSGNVVVGVMFER
jgi:hypothetical protein